MDFLSLFEGNRRSVAFYLGETEAETEDEAAGVKMTFSSWSRRQRCTLA
jgi:hypothetical protein